MAATPRNRDDIVNYITSDANNTSHISTSTFRDDDTFTRGKTHLDAANTHATIDPNDVVKGVNRSSAVHVQSLKDQIKSYESIVALTPDSKSAIKDLERAKKQLKDGAEHVYKDYAKAHSLREKAIGVAEKDFEELTKTIRDRVTAEEAHIRNIASGGTGTISGRNLHTAFAPASGRNNIAVDAVTGQVLGHTDIAPGSFTAVTGQSAKSMTREAYQAEAIGRMSANHSEVIGLAGQHKADYIKRLRDEQGTLKKAAEELEKETGVAHAPHFDSKAVAAAANNLEKGAAGELGMFGKLSKGFSNAHMGTRVFVGALAVAAGYGAYKTVKSFWPGADEQGKPLESDTTGAVVGGVVTAGGLAGIYHLLTKAAGVARAL